MLSLTAERFLRHIKKRTSKNFPSGKCSGYWVMLQKWAGDGYCRVMYPRAVVLLAIATISGLSNKLFHSQE
jgi:hypothetical protein